MDVFASAGEKEMNDLESQQLVDGFHPRRLYPQQAGACGAGGFEASVASFGQLTSPAVKRISVGNPKTVPAGMYAQQLLRHLHLW